MCGIAGLWYRNGRPVEQTALREMARTLAHRGPDGDGLWTDGEIGLAYRRLAIIDPTPDGAQPMHSRDGRFVLLFNGEIHNYRELRVELEAEGSRFRGLSDTEVFLEAYCTWGESCFARFNGMWAAAVWDVANRRLVLSRDHFGIKPLYWTERDSRIAFASEIKALLQIAPEERLPDDDSVIWFLSGASPGSGSRTFFRNVQAVPAATSLSIPLSGRTLERRYWSLTPKPYDGNGDANEFRELLRDSVRLRLRSDVPVGACLSGGLDSSSIVRTALADRSGDLPCFVMRHRDPRYDESRFAAEVAPTGSIHWIDPGPDELLSTTAEIVWHHDAPTPARGRYGQWQTFREAGRHVKVVVDGQGADELLGGYRRFLFPAFLDRSRGQGGWLRSTRDLARSSPSWRAFVRSPLSPVYRRYSSHIRPSAQVLRQEVMKRSPSADRNTLPETWLCDDVERPFRSHLNNALFGEFFHSGLPELLQSEDSMGMAHGVEARPAFLDRRIVELCFSLPPERKIDGTWRKLLLREAMEGILPKSVQWRRDKKGYALPVEQWLLLEDSNFSELRTLLLSPTSASRMYLEPKGVERLLTTRRRNRCQGPAYGGELIWRCLTLELWMRQFLQSESLG